MRKERAWTDGWMDGRISMDLQKYQSFVHGLEQSSLNAAQLK